MHPEEAIEELEETLQGLRISEIEDAVERFFGDRAVEVIGASSEDFARALKMSLKLPPP